MGNSALPAAANNVSQQAQMSCLEYKMIFLMSYDNKDFQRPVTTQPTWASLASNNPISGQNWGDVAMNNPISPISDTLDDLSTPDPINLSAWRKLERGWLPRIEFGFSVFANLLGWAYFIVGVFLFLSSLLAPSGQACEITQIVTMYRLLTFIVGGYISLQDSRVCEALRDCRKADPCCDGPGCCPNLCEPCSKCLKKTKEIFSCIKYWLCCEWFKCCCSCNCQCPKCSCPKCEWFDMVCRVIWSGVYTAWYIAARIYNTKIKVELKDMKEECLKQAVGPSDLLLGLSICIFVCKCISFGLLILVYVKKRQELSKMQGKGIGNAQGADGDSGQEAQDSYVAGGRSAQRKPRV
uniref:Uncharacterized protein n=1 Tax=Strigamia maritima TaxID=126957 RepID=T1IR66_STRMM